MRLNQRLPERVGLDQDTDPRDNPGAEVIDLATRSVLPAVTQRRPKSEGLGLAAGVIAVALLGGITLWSMDAARTGSNAPQPAPAPAPPVPVEAVPAVPPQAITDISAQQLPAPPQQPVLAAPPQDAVATGPVSNPAASPTVVFDASSLPPSTLTAPAGPLGDAAPAAAPTGNSNDDFATRIGGVGGTTARATAGIDPKTTVTQGTLIPAVLETAIDTDVPGYVRAVVSADVRSFDGSRVLVPRSSRLIGQYKSGLQAGQKRAYVIWTRLIRPDGVSVNIASPAIAFSGETGLGGKVNTHFFERFGSAMLLSVIGGLSAVSGGTAGIIIAGSGQSAAAAAVGQSANIGPTVRVRQGEPIRVFTARDLDFSRVNTQ
ncbi:TrbI/VirB10 family protein [Novosphingobium sp.]|uniref:TrbI/VirB10 family protein n=1 Tax=Novosphingobium sp. TaxID=1874826 RepID=UPI0022C18381|nr:TrbI/VirB10 family protein [Novosphingobium sp.]MCZ8019972.1 type VI secretion protein [Novosphingobium sp.]MCZ8035617.1 type VI secretion protein [Novosphingobium sp.]MCZ8053015.1 type VI secretion protein [Novosphingobium sp.]MCZ8061012.1 type VI secretion protein [Novosphingobium sp.]MCZ8230741.1 type VI secretion protein [Novosphingobium sp.]